ncbi:CapA family protein [Burkholderia pyrrocinia]|uniref:CapA family protein n=1 Tax=Burkholderia pyrrocinia TaxID=60550 RepID=UPI002AAFCFB0|nr:CapA family protein [Burkholderia pyrrocinia]
MNSKMKENPDSVSGVHSREPIAATISDGFSFGVAGDLVGPVRPETPMGDAGLMEVVARLRSADVCLANQEGSIFDIDAFSGHRAAEHGGGYPLSDVEMAAEIKALGFDVVTKANNHATDWGIEGLLATRKVLDQAGVAHAGSGPSKAAARAPAYIEMKKGRVAVISAASTFTPMSVAGEADREVGPRPGISVLRVTPVTLLTAQEMGLIRDIATRQGLGNSLDSRATGTDYRVRLGDEVFRESVQPGLTYEVNQADWREILLSVRGAKQISDFVVFALHGHETRSGDGADARPAEFVEELAREAIDAGADLVVVTGPHILRGIEIYRGKPVFYSMGSFYLQFDGGRGPTFEAARALNIDPFALTKPEFMRKIIPVPDDWYDSMIAVTKYVGGVMSSVEILPLRLTCYEAVRIQGAPRIARGKDARRILDNIRALSSPYGTRLEIESDGEEAVGIIRAY